MAKLSHLIKDSRPLTVDFDGQPLAIIYRPSAVTPTHHDETMDLLEKQRVGSALARTVSNILISWDLTDENGKPYPVTEKALRDLPMQLLSKVSVAIQDDIAPNAQKSGTSDGSS